MPTLHCKRCKYTCRSISAMRDHYYKKHPQAMKRKKSTSIKRVKSSKKGTIQKIEALLESLE